MPRYANATVALDKLDNFQTLTKQDCGAEEIEKILKNLQEGRITRKTAEDRLLKLTETIKAESTEPSTLRITRNCTRGYSKPHFQAIPEFERHRNDR